MKRLDFHGVKKSKKEIGFPSDGRTRESEAREVQERTRPTAQ